FNAARGDARLHRRARLAGGLAAGCVGLVPVRRAGGVAAVVRPGAEFGPTDGGLRPELFVRAAGRGHRRLAGAQAGARDRPVGHGSRAGTVARTGARRIRRLRAGVADGLHGHAAGTGLARIAGGAGAVARGDVVAGLAARLGGAAGGFREYMTCAGASASLPTRTSRRSCTTG